MHLIWPPFTNCIITSSPCLSLIATLTASAQHPAQSLQVLSAARKLLKWPFKEHIKPVPKVLFSEAQEMSQLFFNLYVVMFSSFCDAMSPGGDLSHWMNTEASLKMQFKSCV